MTLPKHCDRYVHFHPEVFSPDGQVLVVVGGDGQVQLWDTHTGELVANVQLRHDSYIRSAKVGVAFSSLGQMLAVVGCSFVDRDDNVELWNPNEGEFIRDLAFKRCDGLALSADGALLAIIASGISTSTGAPSIPGDIRIYDTRAGRQVCNAICEGVVRVIAFSPDARRIATASSNINAVNSEDRRWTIEQWNAETGRNISKLPTNLAEVVDLAFSPNGDLLVVRTRSGEVQVIDGAVALRRRIMLHIAAGAA